MCEGGFLITAGQVKELSSKTGCGFMECKRALELRDGIEEYALEWLQRHNIAVVCSDVSRYPKWFKYLESQNAPVTKTI